MNQNKSNKKNKDIKTNQKALLQVPFLLEKTETKTVLGITVGITQNFN